MPVRSATDISLIHMPALSPTLEEEDSVPSATGVDISIATGQISGERRSPSSYKVTHTSRQFSTSHFHRGSESTSASDSTASSPVTAPSLAGSFTNGDTPITSPDTPASSLPPYSPAFKLAARPSSGSKPDLLRQLPPPKELPRPSTGPKKGRNLKNLAVDTSGGPALGRAVSPANLPLKHSVDSAMLSLAPTPSSFNHPPPSRRKSSQLGLKLVTLPSQTPIRQHDSSISPPTPSLVRPNALRHFPSSPLLPLRSPGGPPVGGMQLPAVVNPAPATVGFANTSTQEQDEDVWDRFDVPQSREPKIAAYPDGPICIYDPHVYLYFEPTAEEAAKFDIVLNVASEVKNPFKEVGEQSRSSDAHPDKTASPGNGSSPTTPKAADASKAVPLAEPEYIHVPWEHNTDIVPELLGLTKLVDDRVQNGKSVLIHCQCGVSRSASLVVAYGLYKNPSITVQEAYDAVKRRSKWIGPNMSLIMQLQEFRTELLKRTAGMPSKTKYDVVGVEPNRSSYAEGGSRSLAIRDRVTMDTDDRPRSAPLLPDQHKAIDLPPSIDNLRGMASAVASTPSYFTWAKGTELDTESESTSVYATPSQSPSVPKRYSFDDHERSARPEAITASPRGYQLSTVRDTTMESSSSEL